MNHDQSIIKKRDMTLATRIANDFQINKTKYLMVLPIIIYFVLFAYRPMYGLLMVFQNFSPRLGIAGSEWIGLANFERFFSDPSAWRIVRNTFNISFWTLVFGFPAPILLALSLIHISEPTRH